MYRRISLILLLIALAGVQVKFSGQSSRFVPLAALAALLLMIHLPIRSASRTSHRDMAIIRPGIWFAWFLIVLGCSAALVLYVNPDGRLPWNQRERYIGLPTRSIKPQLYRKLVRTPEVIIFGSSVSFTLPAGYFSEEWDLKAFNMSISGGAPSDFVHLLNFLIKTAPDHRTPSLVTIELLWSDLRPSRGARMPMSLVPYMDAPQGAAAVLDMLDSPLQLNLALDSILTVLYLNSPDWHYDLEFAPDGTGIRTRGDVPLAEYHEKMKDEIALQKRVMSCRKLDTAGVAYVEKLVALSEQYHFAVIIYAPPVNSDFYSMAGVKPHRFESCRRLLDGYMRGLANQHPNVFFSDLADYQPISALGRQVYIDPRHLTREGNLLLLRALEPQINAALEWARDNRQAR